MIPRIGRALGIFWINVGVALIMLIALEGVARIGISVWQRGGRATERAATAQSAVEGSSAMRADDESWGADYSREFAESYRAKWQPYVYWRREPYRGKYINVDAAGFRQTWNQTPAPSPGQLRIFMFGGSTMWGTGARDDFTIPSLVSKKLAGRTPSGVWVRNFGETGYVSTQEVVALILELQRGDVPDVAVFYDGVNDAWAAYQSGTAGIPQNESHRVTEFNSLDRLNLRHGFVEQLALYRIARSVVRARGGAAARGAGGLATQAMPLAKATVDVYLHNIGIVDALANRYRFRAVFFWQPTLYSKRALSAREQQILVRALRQYPGVRAFLGDVDEAFRERTSAGASTRVHDLSGIFNSDAETVFRDQFHLFEAGDDRVAGAITEVLKGITPEGTR